MVLYLSSIQEGHHIFQLVWNASCRSVDQKEGRNHSAKSFLMYIIQRIKFTWNIANNTPPLIDFLKIKKVWSSIESISDERPLPLPHFLQICQVVKFDKLCILVNLLTLWKGQLCEWVCPICQFLKFVNFLQVVQCVISINLSMTLNFIWLSQPARNLVSCIYSCIFQSIHWYAKGNLET